MIPSNLKYGNKVEASMSNTVRSNVAPMNQSSGFIPGQTIMFNIPCTQNSVFAPSESYLKFDLVVTNGATQNEYVRMESCGAHALIQSIKIVSGSNTLEYINNYNVLSKQWYDFVISGDASSGKCNILSGTRSDMTFSLGATGAIENKKYSCKQTNSGIKLNSAALAVNASTKTFTFCLNLISLFGSLCTEKYFPLFACTGSQLRLEVQLVSSPLIAFCSEQLLSGFTLNNVEYIMNIIEISDNALNQISNSLNGQPLQFVVPQFANLTSTHAVSDNALINISIPGKFASVKSIFTSLRDTSAIGVITYFPLSSHHFNLQSYNFKIGYKNLPPKSPTNYIECFSEVLKAVGSFSDVLHQPAIDLDSYSGGLYQYESTATTKSAPIANSESDATGGVSIINSGSFAIGIDLENWSGAVNKEHIWSGYNTNNEDIFLQIQFTDIYQALGITLRSDSFINYDCLLTFNNGIAYASN